MASMAVIQIEKVVYGGYGLGRLDGKVCWVPFSLPGEEIELISASQAKRDYLYADKFRILKASPHRRTALCPFYGECGGCDFQHIDYDFQLQLKIAVVEESAARAGVSLSPLRAVASAPFGYRNRLRIRLNENGFPALCRKKSCELQPIDRCLCVCEEINRILKRLSESPEPSCAGEERQLYLDSNGNGQQFRITAHGAAAMMPFAQINNEVNSAVQEWIVETIKKYNIEKPRLLDLFCGNGNFSLPLAKTAASITGFDLNAEAVDAANRAAAAFSECRIRYRCEDLYRFLRRRMSNTVFDLCLVDPPAAGLKNGAATLAESGFPLIIYISCSPPDLMRDLKVLTKNYTVVDAVIFDMFAQTSKIETAVVLVKK